MPANFAVRFQTKYPTLAEAWRQFARGEVPETFPPEWRGVNYYASVFSNETELPLKVAAQAFLSALDAAKFDGRTYIARLTLATQAFARAVCQSAGLKWEPAPSSGPGIVVPWPVASEKRGPAAGQAVNQPRRLVVPPVAETQKPQAPTAPAPQALPTLSAEELLASQQPSSTSANKKAKGAPPAKATKASKPPKPAKHAKPAKPAKPAKRVRKPAPSKKPVKPKGPAPKAARKPPAAKPAKRNVSKLKPAPKPAKSRKLVKKPVKPKPSAARPASGSKRKA